MENNKVYIATNTAKKESGMHPAWYIALCGLIAVGVDVVSYLLGSVLGGGGEATYVVAAVSILTGAVVCCTLYIADILTRNQA